MKQLALDAYADPLTLSSALRPLLVPGETILLQQRDVGLYDGNKRLWSHDKGVAYISTHRILWVPDDAAHQLTSTAIAIPLSCIVKMEPMPAFVTQSPKIALHLTPTRGSQHTTTTTTTPSHLQPPNPPDAWPCPICSTPNRSTDAKCSECGVKKSGPPPSPLSTTVPSPQRIPTAPTPPPNGNPCKACTFINQPDTIQCIVCATPLDSLPSSEHASHPTLTPHAQHASTQPLPHLVLKLSFRSLGMPAFAKALRSAVQRREWEPISEPHTPSASAPTKVELMSGIGSIMRNVDQSRAAVTSSLSEAFRDLDALMHKASDMVSLAESISARLSAASSASDDSSEMTTFREYLLDLGIASPVTKKAAGNMYDQELARQLAEFLERVLPRSGGMMALVDVYCIFNRARGVALVSPEDLIRACQLFEKLALPYRLRRFDSGLLVLQSQTHHDDDTIRRVRERVQQATINRGGGLTAIQLATAEKISVMLAREQLLMTEARAWICRDDSVEGLRFYDNLIGSI
ncbi:hypothetical protein SeMB42_g01930 [Synchytrium endobioticum]|uniref:Vacuolar protein-sorting-associated protein 36 n=1 Tax=Synchytrium endobioticum TaxID=286115 RepID=A0A507DAD2_9FUNG|nr:hypothetical protein SeLEV6574_g01914 [Synchytrium endobioticum]TPX51420.1 hypothetical protein SeMB42_g01930 [Synchytrium endobioticum]